MDKNAQNILGVQFKKLPGQVQRTILSDAFPDTLREVSLKYSLSEEQRITLSDNVLLIMMGLESLDDLPENLQNEAGIEPEKITPLVNEVSSLLLKPLQEELSTFMREQEGGGMDPTSKEEVGSLEPKKHGGGEEERLKEVLRANNKTLDLKGFLANLK